MEEAYDDLQKEIILRAKKKALRLLEFSDRTEKELRDKLKEGEFPPFAVDEAIEYVRSYHYIDDARYAEHYLLARQNTKSLFEIRHGLSEKGVDSDIIEQTLINTEVDEKETVKRLFLKKYGTKDLTDSKTFEKAIRYFSSHGFRYPDIKAAVTEAVEEKKE